MKDSQIHDYLMKGYRLAYLILDDWQLADLAVENAFLFWPILRQKQKKRLHHQAQEQRRKAILSHWQLLQWQIFERTLSFEKKQEKFQSAIISQSLLIKRYLKFLLQQTWPTRPFHVNIAVSRFIYDFDTQSSMKIYESAGQQPILDESIYRRARLKIVKAIGDRFSSYLEVSQAPNGEIRIVSDPDAQAFRSLVLDTLNGLAPWEPLATEHKNFHQETSAMNQFILPSQFDKLLKKLGLVPPLPKLNLPLFALSGSDTSEGRKEEPEHTTQWLQQRADELSEQMKRQQSMRKSFFPDQIDIKADGELIDTWHVDSKKEHLLVLPAEHTFLDLWGQHPSGKPIALATFSMKSESPKQTITYGHKSFTCTFKQGQADHQANLEIQLSYQAQGLGKLFTRIQNLLGFGEQKGSVWGLLVAFILTASLWPSLYFMLRSQPQHHRLPERLHYLENDANRFSHTQDIATAFFERGLFHFNHATHEHFEAAYRDFELAHDYDQTHREALEYLVLTAEILGKKKEMAKYLKHLEKLKETAPDP